MVAAFGSSLRLVGSDLFFISVSSPDATFWAWWSDDGPNNNVGTHRTASRHLGHLNPHSERLRVSKKCDWIDTGESSAEVFVEIEGQDQSRGPHGRPRGMWDRSSSKVPIGSPWRCRPDSRARR